MYPRLDTAIRHYDVQPHCLILKQGECRSTHSAAPSGRTPLPEAPDARHRSAVPEQIPAVPDEELVGSCAMTNIKPWRRAVTPPVTGSNNAGRSTTDPICQGISGREIGAARPPAIAYSLLLDRRRAQRQDAIPRASRLQRKLAVRLRTREGRVPIRHDSRALQQCAALRSGRRAHSLAPYMQQDTACHVPRNAASASRGHGTPFVALRASAQLGASHEGLWADTYTPVADGVQGSEIGDLEPSRADHLMSQARRGTRALIVCAATC